MSKIIRFVLTVALIYGAYTETGVFTALSLLLVFVAIELNGWLTKRALDATNAPTKALFEVAERFSKSPRQ